MFDIGWTELLVIAVVLIVVVGPKDLPPMLRAFGKMTARARKVAGEFRQQFDEALREAELDDVRQTIADAQKLNPMNTLREAMSPLRDMGNEIKADLQRSTTVDQPAATPAVTVSEPAMALGESAVAAQAAPAASPDVAEAAAKPKAVRKPRAAKAPAVAATTSPVAAVVETPVAPEKPARRTKAVASAPVAAPAVEDKPKRTASRKSTTAVAAAEPEPVAPKKRATSAKKKDNA